MDCQILCIFTGDPTVADYDKLVFLDLETTGPNPLFDRITEIGIVEVSQGNISHWSTLVNPEMPIPAFIQKLTGITNGMVADAPSFPQIAKTVLEKLEGSLFIAHNARFDYGFLRNAFKELGYCLRCDVLCTVKLSRKLFPEEAKHNLDALIARHGLEPSARHRALADAEVLWQLWNTLQASVSAETFADTVRLLLQKPSMPANLAHDSVDDMPDTPGVYLFYGENELPLYVGKSIHLRQRVMSHFQADHRLHKDMRIAHQIHRLEWRETAGEIGALLLEAQLIKDMQPIHNRLLRRQRELCAWQLQANAHGYSQPVLTYASEQDFGGAAGLYGLFSSRRKAEDMLRGLAETHQLCLAMLGLENRIKADKPCFGFQLRRCLGACAGHEPVEKHQARLESALQKLKIKTWPYPGAIGLVEHGPEAGKNGRKDIHVVHNWCYLGTARTKRELKALLKKAPARPAFDADTYKILVRALEKQTLLVLDLGEKDIPLAA